MELNIQHFLYFYIECFVNVHGVCLGVSRFLYVYVECVASRTLYTALSVCVHRGHCQYAWSVHSVAWRGGGLGSSTIFKKFNEPYAPS